MCPSSATIVGLERSLHCLLDSLRKVEPRMLSGIAARVKIRPLWPRFDLFRHAIVSSSRGVSFGPSLESFSSEAHSLIRYPFLSMRAGFSR